MATTRPSRVSAAAWRCRPSERTARCQAQSGRASTASPRRKRRRSSATRPPRHNDGRRGRGGLRDDGVQLARDRLAVGVHQRLTRPGAGLRQHLGQRLAAERTLRRDQLEQDQAERALIALGIELVVASVRLFRRHVERRPDDGAVGRLVVARLGADLGAADGAGPGGARGTGRAAGRRRGGGGLGRLGHQAADAPVHHVDLGAGPPSGWRA